MRIVTAMMMVLVSASAAQAGAIHCPDNVSVASQNLSKKAEGWRYFSDPDAKHALENVYIYKGKKTLTRHEPGKGTETYAQWMLPDNGKEQYYLVCSYKRTAIMLKKLLDAKLTGCKIFFEQDKNRPDAPQQLHKLTCG